MKRITLGTGLAIAGFVMEAAGLLGSVAFLSATGGAMKPLLVILSVASLSIALLMLTLLFLGKLLSLAPLGTIVCGGLGMGSFMLALSGQINYIGMAAVGMNPWLTSLFVMLGGFLLSSILFTVAGFLPMYKQS